MQRVALLPLFALAAAGLHAETYFDTARVRTVEPQYENITVPRQACTQQMVSEVRQTSAPNYGGAVLGGVAGALLGNQVGGGHGREAATALGAVVGAFAGNNLANGGPRYEQVPREVTTCQTVNEVQTRLTGYRVGYDYRGQRYTTFTREQPGPELQVRVSVEPVVR